MAYYYMTPIWRHAATVATELHPPIHVNHARGSQVKHPQYKNVNHAWFTQNWRWQLFFPSTGL